ncbi:MAG: FadR family transcriptional regulator [Anaerolineaceae bacterium]|nr:FadR family transcriptional regulator [Anaerolineaceae bacterium]
MTNPTETKSARSLKTACIQILEQRILSGKARIGEKLPSERQLAEELNVSRPVVHEALVDLAAKGLVHISPRRGTYVNDFRKSGSITFLTSLLNYHEGDLDQSYYQNLIEIREMLECPAVEKAALHRQESHLRILEDLLKAQKAAVNQLDELVNLDFQFHLQLTIASGNMMLPLIINSFRPVYTNLTRIFFQHASHAELETIFAFQKKILKAIRDRDPETAAAEMKALLDYGSHQLDQKL